MLLVALLLVITITVLEALVLLLLQPFGTNAVLVLCLGNATVAAVVSYFVFASIRTVRPSSARAMRVVGDTLPLLRRGLNPETTARAARVMATFDSVRAVLIADRTGILAAAGDVTGPLDRDLLHSRLAEAMESRRHRLGDVGGRPMAIALLRSRSEVLGALGLVGDEGGGLAQGRELARLAGVLAQLLSTQVELGQADRQAQLVAEAELNTLRAQINPHFLFNALNTIIAYSREDPATTRRLLQRLADLFRNSMQSSGQMIPLGDEYEQIKNYLYIEQARFRDKLHVVYDIDPQVLKVLVPALSLQTLVENAVRHGLSKKAGSGTLTLRGRLDFLAMRAVITVADDGVGMDPAVIPDLLAPRQRRPRGEGGLGLANVNERLRRLYGDSCRLQIDSSPGKGTTVTMRIPMR
ncbi:MAG TPA: histidine kinase [Symbiobacteriaceae bacterium]|jgi:two-component system LytT family sensor kinase|nr:histidine kinase [Symbiobacteriaceae bacterium]